MKGNAVVFKGSKEGLHILFDEQATFEDIKESFEKKLDASRNFFGNGKIKMVFPREGLNDEEKQTLKEIVHHQYGMNFIEIVDAEENANGSEKDAQDFPASPEFSNELFSGAQEGKVLFVRNTIRNGQRAAYEGNIVIVGDVNPGGEVIAGGNIIVMGNFRGMAHAGATGNESAIIAAYSLQPTQLRIGKVYTRPPEGDSVRPSYPEIAYVKDNVIVIEPYMHSKGR